MAKFRMRGSGDKAVPVLLGILADSKVPVEKRVLRTEYILRMPPEYFVRRFQTSRYTDIEFFKNNRFAALVLRLEQAGLIRRRWHGQNGLQNVQWEAVITPEGREHLTAQNVC